MYNSVEKSSNYMRKRRNRLRRKGLCVDCGKMEQGLGHTLCENCLEARRIRWHGRYIASGHIGLGSVRAS